MLDDEHRAVRRVDDALDDPATPAPAAFRPAADHHQAGLGRRAHDGFDQSEMEDNPIVVDGVLYATSPKLRVFALDAATGRELWSFDPTTVDPRKGRYRHRGVTVTEDRVFVTHRNRLWALDRKTGKPIATFGDNGVVDLRAGLGRPVETLSVADLGLSSDDVTATQSVSDVDDAPPKQGGETVEFDATLRIDTPGEADYYRNGGIMQYVLRGMLRS